MLLAYLLFFLLHLSASACDATSRNHRIFCHPDVGAPSPVIHDHRHIIAKDLYVDGGYHGEPGGGGDVGGGDGQVGPPPSEATAVATEQEEGSAGDDYAAPKTHPPSHN